MRKNACTAITGCAVCQIRTLADRSARATAKNTRKLADRVLACSLLMTVPFRHRTPREALGPGRSDGKRFHAED